LAPQDWRRSFCWRCSGRGYTSACCSSLWSGASLLIAWRAGDLHVLFRGFERAQIFGAFLPSVLLLRATVEASPQLESLRRGVTTLDRGAVRNWTFYGSHVLGAILNVGAMAILAPVVNRDADDAERRALASSAARGVGTAVMWSPFFVALAFISQLVPTVPIWQPMLIGAGLAAIGFGLSTRCSRAAWAGQALRPACAACGRWRYRPG
jgi:hypothetical protein